MNAMPLPLVLSLAGMSWMEGMPRGYLLFYTPLLLLICIALFQVYPTLRSSAYQSQGPFGCKRQRHISQLVSRLFPSLLSKTSGEGTKYMKNIPVLALLLSDNPVSLLAWRKS